MHARGIVPSGSGTNREKYDGGGTQSQQQQQQHGAVRRTHATTVTTSATNLVDVRHYTWTELEIGGTISHLSSALWQFTHLTKLFLRNNKLTTLPADIARLTNLIHLDMSSNNLHILPPEIGDMPNLRELLLNNNNLGHLPCELGKLFQLQRLELQGNPLPHSFLKVLNETSGTQKLISMLFDQISVHSTPLPQRPWIQLNSTDGSKPVVTFTVMCYNILCDKYCTRQLYGYCPSWALNWEYRKKLILDEIKHYNADVVSLQEVETEQFYTYLLPELKKEGYAGVFSAKSRARTMAEHDRKHVDGCSIFYKTNKFRAVKDHLIEFNQLAIEAADGSHDMINRVMTKDNIGLALLLESTESVWSNGLPADPTTRKQLVLIATCHVHWDPEFCDVKLIQTMMLMHRLQSIIKDIHATHLQGSTTSPPTNTDCNQLPLILCGDLNSLPDSGVVEYLTNGRVNANHKDFKEIGYDCLCKLSCASDVKDIYTHGFRLLQAYSRDTLPFTNYTYDFKGIIDYIFYGQDMMRPLGVLGSLDWSWFEQNRVYGCPHPSIPSDHLPLLVQFELLTAGAMTTSGSSISPHQQQQLQPQRNSTPRR